MIRTTKLKLNEIVEFYNPDLKRGAGGNGQFFKVCDIMYATYDFVDTVVIKHVTKDIEIYVSDYELLYLIKVLKPKQKLLHLLYK